MRFVVDLNTEYTSVIMTIKNLFEHGDMDDQVKL